MTDTTLATRHHHRYNPPMPTASPDPTAAQPKSKYARRYSPETKRQAIQRVLAGETLDAVAKDTGIAESSIAAWTRPLRPKRPIKPPKLSIPRHPKIRKNIGETSITPVVIDRVAKLVREGNYVEIAAKAAGVNRDTLTNWLNRGAVALARTDQDGHAIDNDDYLCAQFVEAIEEAAAKAETADLNRIRHAAADPKYWKAAAWHLERRYQSRWGRKESLEISGPNGGPIPHQTHLDLTRLSADEARTLQALLDKAQPQDDAAEQPRQIEAQVSEVGQRADATPAGSTGDKD